MKHQLFLCAAAILMTVNSCQKAESEISSELSLREKVGKLFFVRPEAYSLFKTAEQIEHSEKNPVTSIGPITKMAYRIRPAGGFCIFGRNLVSPGQLKNLVNQIHSLKGHPLVSIDEEGGRVSRIANNPDFNICNAGIPGELAAEGDSIKVSEAGKTVGTYLKNFGIDIDFAPVADVNSNPRNTVIGTRAFGSEPELCGRMASAWLEGLQSKGVKGCLKHFPGHGDTEEDTHAGFAVSRKNWDQLSQCEMVPFRIAIEAGAGMVMVAHVSVPEKSGDNTPSTMSAKVVTGLLRDSLGFDGVIITDAMAMGAIASNYDAGEAAIAAIKAGVDIILMPSDYRRAFDAVLEAVKKGEISESRINESLGRIAKISMQ